jgi:hypothetical protein
MQDTMEIITQGRKGKYLNTLEKYIYKASKDNLNMNDTHIDTHNPIFKTLHEIYTRQQYTHLPHSPPTTKTQYKYRSKHSTHASHLLQREHHTLME